jgi:hypothetical protein
MSPSIFTRAALVAGLLASTTSAAFDPSSKKNVAMYWGQGSNQIPLIDVCADPNIDIVNIGCKWLLVNRKKVVKVYIWENSGFMLKMTRFTRSMRLLQRHC